MEKKTSQDRRRVHYEVQTRRDTKLIKRFINFKNRVEHPTVTPGLILIGITFILLPFVRPEIKKDIGNSGVAVSALIGAFLTFLGIGRQYITIALMKRNPDIALNEEINYLFGNEEILQIQLRKGQLPDHEVLPVQEALSNNVWTSL